MRKILFIIAAMAALATGAKAQDRIFVYRNDGGFDAFLKSEVDSMTLSHEDAEGKYHAGWETQLIHTPDSTYRIPLAAIDSISFFAPPTILNKDVFILTAEHDAYITRADTVSFTFAPGTPEELLPEKGNLVVSRYDCTSFPDGIVARVTYVAEDAAGMHYECERAGIDEVFDQILLYEECIPAQDTHSTRAAGKREINLWKKTYEAGIAKGNTLVEMTLTDAIKANIVMRKVTGQPFYFKLEIENDINAPFNVIAQSQADIYESGKIINNISLGKIPIPYTPLFIVPKLSLSRYFNITGDVTLEAEANFKRNDKISFVYNNGEWACGYVPTNEAEFNAFSLSMEGAAEIGITPELLFSLCGTATGIGANFSAGLKEYVNFKFDALEYFNTGAYAAIKDSYARTTAPYSISVFAQAGLFDFNESPRWTYTYSDEKQIGNNKYIVPEFSEPICTRSIDGMSEIISTNVSRDLLLPVNLGYAVYDDEGNFITSKYNNSEYQNATGWLTDVHSEQFSNLEDGDYVAYPLVKLMGKELMATPSKEFTITNDSALIGTWQFIYSSFMEEVDMNFPYDMDFMLTFNSDHTGRYSDVANNYIIYWNTVNSRLTIMIPGGYYTTQPYEIKDNFLYLYGKGTTDKITNEGGDPIFVWADVVIFKKIEEDESQ